MLALRTLAPTSLPRHLFLLQIPLMLFVQQLLVIWNGEQVSSGATVVVPAVFSVFVPILLPLLLPYHFGYSITISKRLQGSPTTWCTDVACRH
jgi:hypothetical protein